MKAFTPKKPSKDEREKLILLGLVELYIKTGRPVGSQTLQENGFNTLSPATLRNYFSKLEENGLLKQQHSSGGRIPTSAAYKAYVASLSPPFSLEEKMKKDLQKTLIQETREVHAYLENCVEEVARLSNGAAFLSLPRFDQDFVMDVRLVSIDAHRLVCIFVTDFGNIQTEMLHTHEKLSSFDVKRIEQYFQYKISNLEKPTLSQEEEQRALLFYNEAMLRHIVNYSNFTSSDILKTGFSAMLSYPDFNDASSLAGGLSLFENTSALQKLLSDSSTKDTLSCWIGDDLEGISSQASTCSVITHPYHIHQNVVGSIGVLCPNRVNYKKVFALLGAASEMIGSSLTKSLYKHKISYRKPNAAQLDFKTQAMLLVENKTSEKK